jgi:hypothetical protein
MYFGPWLQTVVGWLYCFESETRQKIMGWGST